MSTYSLNCCDPTDQSCPHNPQAELIRRILNHTGDATLKIHGISGRGGGKTACSVIITAAAAFDDPGSVGLVTAPTYDELGAIWVQSWEEIVPPELYRYRDGGKLGRRIEVANGTIILLRSRHINNVRRGRGAMRGINATWSVNDESAKGFDREQYVNQHACIRRHGKRRFNVCITTPVLGDYYDLVHSPNHNVVHWTSRDNPWLPPGWVDDLATEMSSAQAEREIEGKWVALEGLVWKTWKNKEWPRGNIHEHKFRPGNPFYLFLDLGVGNGAYVIVQLAPGRPMGPSLQASSVWVACAEFTPQHDGSASRAFQKIKQIYGTPCMIIGGADMGTRASTDALDAMYFARQVFGGGVPVQAVSGWQASKQVQYDRLSYLILQEATNERRFCISKHFVSHSPDAKRGIRELMVQDTFPDNAGKVKGVFLNKEGRLEHIRDALLYGAVGIMSPPKMMATPHRPA